jgi:hypothetical protein
MEGVLRTATDQVFSEPRTSSRVPGVKDVVRRLVCGEWRTICLRVPLLTRHLVVTPEPNTGSGYYLYASIAA